MEKLKRLHKTILVALMISYLFFVLSTISGVSVLMRTFSPLTASLAASVIYISASICEPYKKHMTLLGLGVLSWTIGDVIYNSSVLLGEVDILDNISSVLFLLPNYFFGLALVLYLFRKLNKDSLNRIAFSSFAITIIGFVLLRKFLDVLLNGHQPDPIQYARALLYIFINFFIMMILFFFITMVKGLTLRKGTCFIPLGIFFYILIDFDYTYKEALGRDPENVYMNLLYMLFIIMIAHGTFSQSEYGHTFDVTNYERTKSNSKFLKILVAVLVAIDIFFYFIHFLSENEFFFILIAIMGYWIMSATHDNTLMDQALLKQQKEQNQLLEKQVEEKTKDLQFAYENLQKLSSTDILTGIYNRRYNAMYLRNLTNEYSHSGQSYAVFAIDLNHFKPINDAYGHDMGDRVLAEFGQRMLRLPKNLIPFRTGGDEFMIVMEDVINRKDVLEAAEKLQKLFDTPVVLDTYSFNLSGSIGISLYPEDSSDSSLIVSYADAAMYSVKKSSIRDDYKFFDKALVESVEHHKILENILKKADPDLDFTLNYQPIVEIETGKLIGAEVFPRLKRKIDFEYSTGELIPIAEECGLMGELGKWISTESVNQIKKWNDESGRELNLSINMSALQLLDSAFIGHLKKITQDKDFPSSKLGLDISTNVMLSAEETSKEALLDLGSYGFPLCLNDFGGGELRLSNFLDCTFTMIKLSPSLVDRAGRDKKALQLISSIHALADSLQIKTCAVGIENEDQAIKLKEIGITIAQGYFYGKPCSASEFKENFLKN
ncbi:putative bifunctional diguanylate cyclase/phosphodiesterase [Butyrivibrio sp. VCD2006]|uniref:putative bifunctional diguanylate cyclase/phosphodiesterase n=1 Tax=Butyrivibrio sp. VCD2006 TaxID=1280664 RepID=UPI0004046CB1|nr:EAL domain-containing protein [Butyrivibrio sp. VCD2006]